MKRLGFGIWILGVGLSTASAAGCAKADAAALVPDGPPLAMPAPPPRVITPVEEVAVVPPPATPEPAAAVLRTPPTPPARPETKTEAPPAVAAQPAPPTPAAVSEPREVRAIPSGVAAAEEKKVRDLMDGAARDLNRVDYQRLSVEGKLQYDQSKRFSEQAEQALKEKNFDYAMTLADKAAKLAAELAGRR
jgi:hypothetical protein